MAASISLVSFWAICAFPWILSGAAAAFPVALAAGWLEQPPSPARVSTRKYKVPALRCIRRALAFNMFFVPYEVITGQGRGHVHRQCLYSEVVSSFSVHTRSVIPASIAASVG